MIVYLVVGLLAAMFFFGTLRYVLFGRLADPASSAGQMLSVDEAALGGARDVSDVLEPIRREHKLPALAAAMVKNGDLVALGAAGVRRAGGTERVGVHDQFHIGSCTKPMTAMLAAMLIEEGKLRWDSTVAEIFGDVADKLHPEYRSVTLEQLLTHRSGLAEDRQPDRELWPKVRALAGPMFEQRKQLVELALSREPAAAPGTKHQYSNIGYAIAGAMCERVTGTAWEDLMRERIFKPLGMTSAGFGPPGSAEKIDQPWGHLIIWGAWKPMPPGPAADNPAVIGPAGTVHCSVADWAKFAAVFVRPEASGESLVSEKTLRKLLTPVPGDDYAFGWLVRERGWAGGKAYVSLGSNTMWFADVWLAPERSTAYLAATNVGTDSGFLGCDAAISALIHMADTLSKPKPPNE
jgi:CubicO group peptidase (beta-lactamase class C family)